MRRRLLFALAAPLAAIALVSAPATAVADTSCAAGSVCFWTGTNFTGDKVSITSTELAGVPVYGGLMIDPTRRGGSPYFAVLYRSAKNRIASPTYSAAFGAGPILGGIAALPYGADVASFPPNSSVANFVRRQS